jgi:hypothetical protein
MAVCSLADTHINDTEAVGVSFRDWPTGLVKLRPAADMGWCSWCEGRVQEVQRPQQPMAWCMAVFVRVLHVLSLSVGVQRL